jgi:hypothetical protein
MTWQEWLAQKYENKAEQAQHFISWQTMTDLKLSIN